MLEIKLQEIIDRFYNSGINDLELKIFKNGDIELGYWSYNPATMLEIKNNNIKECSFFPAEKPSDYIFASKEKRNIIFETVHWIWRLIRFNYYINTDNAENVKNIKKVFKEE